ncbi:hypothetical protein KFK09_016296 [Dendrobium nobile]|uniref:Uncharacterized protein n=1 Tax=Dendrobium nobile TaxID=94219 RepID=A0A8T3AZ44_DENNO|nr:hypothetical protein KFK09_016296 [Dendrobium nobile]
MYVINTQKMELLAIDSKEFVGPSTRGCCHNSVIKIMLLGQHYLIKVIRAI